MSDASASQQPRLGRALLVSSVALLLIIANSFFIAWLLSLWAWWSVLLAIWMVIPMLIVFAVFGSAMDLLNKCLDAR